MRAGGLRHWLYFEDMVSQQDSDGNLVQVWVDAFASNTRMPCEVSPLSGRELIAAQGVHSKVSHRIRARFRPGQPFTATMRARDDSIGFIYGIEAVIPDSDSGRDFVTLLASSGVNQGGTA